MGPDSVMATQTAVVSRVGSALEALEKSIHVLTNEIELTEGRLSPVLSPATPENGAKEQTVPSRPSNSDLANIINEKAEMIGKLIARLSRMNDRIEL